MTDMNNRTGGRHFKTPAQGSAQGSQPSPQPIGGPSPYGRGGTAQQGAYASRPAPQQNPYEQDSYQVPNAYGVTPLDNGRSGRSGRKRSKAPFVVAGVIAVLLVAIAGAGAMALFSAKDLKAQASEVMQGVSTITEAAKTQDFAVAADAAQNIANVSSAMNDSLSSPLWTVASLVPVYGQDISSARTLVSSLNNVATEALVPVMEALEANPPTNLISSDKTINVEAVGQLFGALGAAAGPMQACSDTVSGLPAFHVGQLEDMMGPAREKLVEVNGMIQNAADIAPLAEAILGANGDRTYLIAAQNSTEMRASGGFPGSMGTLRITGGKIELDEFSKVYDVLADKTAPSLNVTDAERNLFGGFMDTARDAGMDPDFTRVAEIWAVAFEEKTGTHVDGVISVTPAVVQDLLAIAGSITLEDGTVVDGTNATRVLQHDLYWNYLSADTASPGNGDLADALFAQAADLAFEQFFSGLDSATLAKFLDLMGEAIENRSVMFWLADLSEQELLAPMGCSGDVVTDPLRPAVGTYLSLWIPSKMGWYIDIENQIVGSRDNGDGTRTYDARTTYRNTAELDVLLSAGDYIAGNLPGYERYNLHPDLLIYAPTGGEISNLSASNGAEFVEGEHKGLQVFRSASPDLRAGESITVTYEVTTAKDAEELAFMATPTLTQYR